MFGPVTRWLMLSVARSLKRPALHRLNNTSSDQSGPRDDDDDDSLTTTPAQSTGQSPYVDNTRLNPPIALNTPHENPLWRSHQGFSPLSPSGTSPGDRSTSCTHEGYTTLLPFEVSVGILVFTIEETSPLTIGV
jgi:hypothetical protein